MCKDNKHDIHDHLADDDAGIAFDIKEQTLRELEKLSSYDEFRVALDALTVAGCEPLRVVWLLGAIVGWNNWRTISRAEMTESAEALNKAEQAVKKLFFSQASAVLNLTSLELAGNIKKLADSTERLAPAAHTRRLMAANMAKAALVQYVHRATNEFQDNHVSAVVSVALNNAGLQSHLYTRDAHIRWRNRPPYRQFLEGAAQDRVTELLQAMEAEFAD